MAANQFGDEEFVPKGGQNTFGDEEIVPGEPGIISSAKRGWQQANAGRAATNMANLSGEVAGLEGDTSPEAEARRQALYGGIQNSVNDLRMASTKMSAFPKSEGQQQFEAAKGWIDPLQVALTHPIDVIGGVTAESLGSQGKTLPLIAGAGMAGGVPGLAFAVGASSLSQEFDSGTLELLSALNVNLDDPAAVARAMTSPEFRAARYKKLAKAATIAAVDTLTAGTAGVTLGKTPMRNIAAQTGVQMAGGAGGELAGELMGDEEISPSSIYAEALGEIPGGIKETGTIQLHNIIKSQVLGRAAGESQKQAEFGLNSEEQKTADDVTGAGHKQKMTPLQTKVFLAANAAGVNPQAALTIVGIESGFNPGAKNPNSTAHGLFQQLDKTWAENGGGDRNNVDQQIANGLNGLLRTQQEMEKRLGRNVSPEELYYGHLLGARGGMKLAMAADADPNGSFLDLVRTWDPEHADAIVKNNGLAGLTNEQAARKIDGMYQRKSVALGNDEALNRQTKASPEADTSPNESSDPQTALDESVGLEDLDAMFAAIEDQPLTREEIDGAAAEEVLHKVDEGHATAESALDATLLDDQTDESTTTEAVIPRLPRELAGASPKYGFANKMFAVDFASDVDRAAYIIAREDKKSERDADFLKFVMEQLQVDETGARAYGKQVRAQIKELAREAKDTDTAVIRLEDKRRAESWVSLDEQDTRDRYPNPNDKYRNRISLAPVVAASDGNVGMTLAERKIQSGEVVAVGEDSRHSPLGYMQAMQQTLQEIISRFAPNARIALTFQTEGKGVVSSQTEMKGIGTMRSRANGLGLYKINMRNATGLGVSQDGTSNPTTQRKITYAAYHEAGHVVVNEQMLQGMSPAMRDKFLNLGTDEYFDEADLVNLSPEQANVLREYNQLKWQTLNDPTFTAEAFARAWLSPWKLGHGAGGRQGLFSFVKQFLGQAAVQKLNEPAKNFALTLDQYSQALSPHEYMAEQFSRYAFSSGMAEASPLSRNFFQRALDTLRQFFKAAKAEGAIKPGEAFAAWVDSFTALSKKPAAPVVDITEAKQPKPRIRKKAEPKAEPPSLLPPAITKKAEQRIETVRGGRFDAKQQANFALLSSNLSFVADENPGVYKHWSELITAGRLEDFRSEVAAYVDDEFAEQYVRYDRDSPDYEHWAQVNEELDRAVPKRAELKRWLPSGLRNLSNAKYFFMTLEQMSMRFPEVAGLQALAMMKTNYKAFKAKLEYKGLEVAQRWSKLGKEQHGLLERAMKDEHASGEHIAELTKVNGALRFVPNAALVEYARKHGLEEGTVQVWLDAKNAHLAHMNALQNVIARKMQQRYASRPNTLKVKMHELASQFEVIRSTPFLPQTRFGQYALRVVEDGLDGKQTVHVEFFESAAMRDEAMAAMKKATGKYKQLSVQPAFYRPASAVLRTLPPQILTTWADELELTTQERKELREIADSITRNPTLRKYSLQLAAITGANKDLLRNFGDFMWHSSNAISKTLYREHMKKAVLQIEADMQDAAYAGDVAWHDELVKLRQFASDYVDHMMSPQDEWQKVRAFVVYKQLWFNVKSALANLNSLFSIWALSARQQGIVGGTARNWEAIGKAAADSFARVAQRVLRRPVEGAAVFNADTKWAMDQAMQDGLLDESFAAQLANFANAGTLSRLNFQRGDSMVKKALWLGMQPQHLVERFVREVGLITHFEHYKREGLGNSEAYLKARGDVIATQGDNSLLNRPEFMRGKWSKFLIYYGYMQQQLYLFSGAQERARNYTEAYLSGATEGMTNVEARKKFFGTKMGGETLKMWMAYLALGGIMGLPGAEDLDDIMELIAKKFFGAHFSLREYAYKLAGSISEEASSYGIDLNPRSIVHGTFADFSPLWVGPSIDLSGSTSMGHVLPGSGTFGAKDANEGVVKMLGPLGGALKDTWEGAFGDDPNKRFGFLPTGPKNLATTLYDWEKGVTASNGGKITIDRNTGAVRELTTGEKLAMLGSFTPEIVAANKELHWMQRDVQLYWMSRRNQLIAQIAEARQQGDREAMADANDALAKFNETAPAHIGITPKELRHSLKRRDKAATATERGISRNKRFRALDRELEQDQRGASD